MAALELVRDLLDLITRGAASPPVNRRAAAVEVEVDLDAVLANSPRVQLTDVPPGSICLDDDGAPLCVWPTPSEDGSTCSYGEFGPVWPASNGPLTASGRSDVVVLRGGGLTYEQCVWLMEAFGCVDATEHATLVRRKLAHLADGGTPETFKVEAARESSAA